MPLKRAQGKRRKKKKENLGVAVRSNCSAQGKKKQPGGPFLFGGQERRKGRLAAGRRISRGSEYEEVGRLSTEFPAQEVQG